MSRAMMHRDLISLLLSGAHAGHEFGWQAMHKGHSSCVHTSPTSVNVRPMHLQEH